VPLTNLALAMQADPRIARRIGMIYSMARTLRVEGNELSHRRAEWNVYIDAAAADGVLRSGAPMTFIPLNASDNVPITPFQGRGGRTAADTGSSACRRHAARSLLPPGPGVFLGSFGRRGRHRPPVV